jgi:hypothetical protein
MVQNDENTFPPIDEPVDPALLEDGELQMDFASQEPLTDPVDASGANSSNAEDPAAEGDDVYVPPTDPVVTTDAHGAARILGGFSATSLDSVEVDRSESDGRLGDEAIAEAVRRELAEDAMTTDLQVNVLVVNGVVHLRGVVADLDDADRVEEVAGRVPGVREVIEELDVADV